MTSVLIVTDTTLCDLVCSVKCETEVWCIESEVENIYQGTIILCEGLTITFTCTYDT